jgi:hypothetical protein
MFPASFAVDIELDGNHRELLMTTLTTTPVHTATVQTATVQTGSLQTAPLQAVPVQTVPLRAVSLQTVPLQAVSLRTVPPQAVSIFSQPQKFWVQNREATLNWLALGLLLAAWNAADGGDDARARRPDSLRGYSSVSVRAVQHSIGRFDHAG